MRHTQRTAAILASISLTIGMTAAYAPAVNAAPTASITDGSLTVQEGQKTIITGKVPAKYGKRLVVLELTGKQGRQEIGTAFADKNGNVKMTVHLGGDGDYRAQWRVVKNGKTQWASKDFDLKVVGSKKTHKAADSVSRIDGHTEATPSVEDRTPARKPAKKTRMAYRAASDNWSDTATVNSDWEDSTAESATKDAAEGGEDAVKSTGEMLGDLGDELGDAVGVSVIAWGVNTLLNLIPGVMPDAATAAQVEALTQDVIAGFNQVESQLTTIQSDLNVMEGQVNNIQSEVVAANANAAAASCNAILSEANGYVQDIKDAYGNYQTVMNPTWISANLVGQSGSQAAKIAGEQIYGAGAGTPSYAQGVVSLQNTVTGLTNLLASNGASSTAGLISTCSTAVSSQIVAENLNNTPGTIVALGSIEQQYYDKMHNLVNYYTAWMNVGQVIATQGGRMAAATLQGASANGSPVCSGVAGQAGASPVTCPGIVYNTNNAIAVGSAAINSLGGSWYDVSNGLVVGDARVDNTSDYVQPAQSAWVRDIALYGELVEGLQNPVITPASTTYSLAASGGTGWGVMDSAGNVITTYGGSVTQTGTIAYTPMMSFTSTQQGQFILKNTDTNTVVLDTYIPAGTSGIATYSIPLSVGTNTFTATWPDGSVDTLTLVLDKTTTPATATYYTPSGALSSLTEASSTLPQSSTGSGLANPSWMGANWVGASTGQFQHAFPLQDQPAGSAFGTVGGMLAASGLTNYGAAPTNLLLYTGDTNSYTFPTSMPGLYAQLPAGGTGWGNVNGNQDYYWNQGGTVNFPTASANLFSFMDTNMNASPGQTPIVSGANGSYIVPATFYTNNSGYTLADTQQASNNTNILGQVDPTPTYSLNSVQSVQAGFGTANSSFYAPISLNESWVFTGTVDANDNDQNLNVTFQNLQTSISSLPAFMGNGSTSPTQTQFMWPTLDLTAATPPCTLSNFTTGVNGAQGGGQVCQQWYIEWAAGALGVQTGPVGVRVGSVQGTKQPSGNYSATVALSNSSGSVQNVSLYANVSDGDATLGTLVNAGDSSGANGNGLTVSNCTVTNGDLLCDLSVPAGASELTIPLTGSFSNSSSLNVSVGASGMAASSGGSLLPVSSQNEVIPAPVADLTVTPNTNVTDQAAVAWTVPAATPEITGYNIVATGPDGKDWPLTFTYASGTGTPEAPSGSLVTGAGFWGEPTAATAWTSLVFGPGAPSGLWTISVAAVNDAGAGTPVSATATIGNSAPLTPLNFTASETSQGTVLLDWDPVTSNPPLSEYTLTITAPAIGTAAPVVSNVSTTVTEYEVQDLTATGTWQFSLIATNSVGDSDPATTSLNVTGMVPTQPLNLDVDVDTDGWVSAWFTASESVPSADSYYVALFEPGQSTPIASVNVPTYEHDERVRVRNFYQLSTADPTGTYRILVTPTNSIGAGEAARSSLYVSQALINEVQGNVARDAILAEVPDFIQAYASEACIAGNWKDSLNVFGTCSSDYLFTPIAAPVGASNT